jgi:intracellular sulfur oxidation DsrE/DsrF family protein
MDFPEKLCMSVTGLFRVQSLTTIRNYNVKSQIPNETRHNAIPFAMEDRLWKKYNFGEVFKVTDNTTKKPAIRNPFYQPGEGDFPFPTIEGIQKMQARGAMFCVCNMALKVYSGVVAKASNLNPTEVYEDWKSGVHKDIQIVPSGVWAVGRAQENGFGYCYAGG